ncbi:signal transduction histidine kinase [Kineococcus xinjiangensis]|uniref:histidine kinase n=1 Tax=Kineococcus xinjiangensis TaxID=512762 RepID=A0A2S6ID13_9ACTN|nr:HAMP domain-containing sensor histidine kinase [Kineococcus xinjiangensis]PPK92087.1 signal transduction histidine kinase [Kineococcus xinjiangensis]
MTVEPLRRRAHVVGAAPAAPPPPAPARPLGGAPWGRLRDVAAGGREVARRARRGVRTVRVKVLLAVVLTAAAGTAMEGTVSHVVQVDAAERRMDASLHQEVEQLRTLARTGVDPATGAGFTSVDQLLRATVSGHVAEEGETRLAVLDGVPAYRPAGPRPVELEEEPAVMRVARSLRADSPAALRTVPSSAGDLRLAAVPVTLPGSSQLGVLVVTQSVDVQLRGVREGSRTFATVALGVLLLVALVGWGVTGHLLRPLQRLRATTQAVGADALTGRTAARSPVRGDDDVADLARSFNGMLDRLEEAFTTQRQFLQDAGHELRTPLTIIRGHLEVMDPAAADDVRETRDLVLDEVERVSRLVDDLSVLASARRPDFLAPRTVDAGRLLEETFEKALALGRRRWLVDARPEVLLRADPQRLAQALLQLASNAVSFTDPGDVVALGGAVRGGALELWVRDCGPGVAPEDAGRIFERFGRSRAGRAGEGSGLGLAIVSSIAEAHGGRVRLSSRPGAGATFTLVLPLDPGVDAPVGGEAR